MTEPKTPDTEIKKPAEADNNALEHEHLHHHHHDDDDDSCTAPAPCCNHGR